VGGDGGTHRPRAEHRHPAYPMRHRTSISLFPSSQSLPTGLKIASRNGWCREVLECEASH
jgi:hypothetical protein